MISKKIKKVISFCLVSLFALSLTSCLTPDTPTGPGSSCSTTGEGKLDFSVTSPAGITPNILVKGSSASTSINGSETLDLAAGTYQLQVQRVVQTNEIVSDAFGALSPLQEVCVKADETVSVSVDYGLHPASGHLWSTNTGGLVAFSREQLRGPNSQDASIKLNYNFNTFRGLTFDSMGHMFAAQFGNDAILVFKPNQLVSSDNPTEALKLTSSVIDGNTYGLTFDEDGNLWGSTWTTNIIFRYDAATINELILKGGEQEQGPDYQFSVEGAQHVRDIEFDADGNLWAGTDFQTEENKLMRFSKASLSTNNPSPAFSLEVDTPSVPSWLGFDSSNRLWLTYLGKLVRYSDAQLSGSGTQTLTFDDANFFANSTRVLTGLVVDRNSEVWIADNLSGIRKHEAEDTDIGSLWITSEDLRATQDLIFYPSQ